MRFQADRYSCGVFAIMNALRAAGVKVSEKRVRAHSGTTEEHGTSEHGIRNALERIGWVGEDLVADTKAKTFQALLSALDGGSPVILCVDDDQHWVAAVGRCGKNVIVHDSGRTKKNKAEHGSQVYTKKKLTERWENRKGKLFGIVVKKKAK